MGRFDGKCVVVTGASSGIGHRIALDFAREGANVIAVARREDRLKELAALAQQSDGRILPYPGDITLREVNEAMIDYALEHCDKLDVLVNNAGVMDEFKPIVEVTDEHWEWVMSVNLYGPMYAMRKAVAVMLNQKTAGNIVNVASIGGVHGGRAGAAYTASKHALVGLTENTAYMYAPNNIRVNVVCPGGVESEVMSSQKKISTTGMGRVMATLDKSIPKGKAKDIASAVLYVASDEAKFITGATIAVDGGAGCN